MLWYLHMRHNDKAARKMRESKEQGKREGKERNRETGRPTACYIGQECRCHGNRQPSIGIWSSKWNYCRGFDVQYTSGGQLIWRYNQLLCLFHAALAIPCLGQAAGTRATGVKISLAECQIYRQLSPSWQMFVPPRTTSDWQMYTEHEHERYSSLGDNFCFFCCFFPSVQPV